MDINALYVLDFETYFDKDYTLKKLTTEAYVRDFGFEALGLAVVHGNERLWIERPHIPDYLWSLDWSKVHALAHHAQFDGLILRHVYDVKPAYWYDTLSMARAVLGQHLSVSLDSLSRHFDLAAKTVPYELFRGKRYADIAPDRALMRRIGDGALHDAALCRDIFSRMVAAFPAHELDLIDLTVRMFTEPVLEADIEELGRIWVDEEKRRRSGLEQLGVTEADVQSAAKFEQLLTEAGIEIEYKDGKTGKIPCFAKTDRFMEELLEHSSGYIQSLARLRLGLRSTIDQTRAERLGDMSTRGRLPVYLKYAGAHTLRWSGGDRVNWQNFRRGGRLRKTICAPPNCTLVIADASQIECRILNCWAGQQDVIDKFKSGEDPYIGIASQAYGRPITKDDKAERGTGKQLELSCGYGAGTLTIQRTARLGIYGPAVEIPLGEAERWKQLYRQTHPYVVNLWREAEATLTGMYHFKALPEWRGLQVYYDEATGLRRISVPDELPLIYDTLTSDGEWHIRTRRGFHTKMYGAKLVENIVQYMARIYLAHAMNTIRQAGIRIAMTTHDEIVAVVPAQAAEQARQIMVKAMTEAPAWMPDLPLDVEVMTSDRYEK